MNVGLKHRDIAALRDVAKRNLCVNQRGLKRERTTDDEADQVVPPDMDDIRGFLDDFTVFPDPILGEIMTNIDPFAELWELSFSGCRYPQHRTRFWVALAKNQKVLCVFGGQDDEIALNQVGCETRGMTARSATAELSA